jgi:hypothetical protein
MKKVNLFELSIFLIALMLLAGRSSRIETPVIDGGSTIVYPGKKADDISAKITLCRKFDKKTGEPLGAGTVFSVRENANLQAVVNLENHFNYFDGNLMFHLDWIGPNGRSIYRKQLILSPGGGDSTIKTSISISPEKRQPGEYSFRIYYFRELIAEKKFELRPEFIVTPSVAEELAPQITLYRKVSKKTGKLIGEGTVFTMKDKRRLRAKIDLTNRFAFSGQEMMFHIDWIGPDGNSVYKKRFDLYPEDSASTIKSSISISPNKRQRGEYSLRLLLFNQTIAEKKFELR